MSKKTVLVFAHSSGFSGAERSLVETLNLIKDEFDVYVVVPEEGLFLEVVRKFYPGKFFVIKSYFFYEKPGASIFKLLLKQIVNLVSILRCFLVSRRVDPDIIYSNTVSSWVGPIVSVLSGKEHVWHLREIPGDDSVGRPVWGEGLEKKLLSISRFRFIANSYYTQEWYRKHRGISPVVAYQPVSLKKISKNTLFEKATRQSIRVGVFGRLTEEKRQHIVLKALGLLQCSDLQCFEVFFYGKGPKSYLKYLSRMLGENTKEKVFFKGYLTDIGEVLSSVDLVIVPSAREPFGRVTIEAMLCGVPVIGADSGGTSELIGKDEARGKLFPLDDFKRLSQLLVDFKEHREPFEEKAKSALEWVSLHLSEDEYKNIIFKSFRE